MNHNKVILLFTILLVFLSSCTKAQTKNENNYFFDNTKFDYLTTYPSSISQVYKTYTNDTFVEEVFESGYLQHLGAYAYVIKSKNIGFYFWGDTKEEAALYIVEIYTPLYENPNAKLIGMSVELAKVLIEKSTKIKMDQNSIIIFSPDSLFYLQIQFDGNNIISYSIKKEL